MPSGANYPPEHFNSNSKSSQDQNVLKKKLSLEHKFSEVIFTHIGNPHQFNQKPITFNREVLSCVMNPSLIGTPFVSKDASNRAQKYLNEIVSVGSYTHSLGIPTVRKTVARYLSREDNVP